MTLNSFEWPWRTLNDFEWIWSQKLFKVVQSHPKPSKFSWKPLNDFEQLWMTLDDFEWLWMNSRPTVVQSPSKSFLVIKINKSHKMAVSYIDNAKWNFRVGEEKFCRYENWNKSRLVHDFWVDEHVLKSLKKTTFDRNTHINDLLTDSRMICAQPYVSWI